MNIEEFVSLKNLTTLRVGGNARYLVRVENLEDLLAACNFASEHSLPVIPLGGGSNVLAPDEELSAVVLLMRIPFITYEELETTVRVHCGAGVEWNEFIDGCVEQELWGVENLAGIPGTVGAAPVQNIGAYGASVSDCIEYVEAYDTAKKKVVTFTAEECEFGYRESRFKNEKNIIITGVSFLLTRSGAPNCTYPDFTTYMREHVGDVCTTPRNVAFLVREIRKKKFPNMKEYGTAGSFFKNPVLPHAVYESLKKKYPELPGFNEEGGTAVKIPLAWILDHTLSLRGYREGNVELFNNQPLVLVTHAGATAQEVKNFATIISEKVFTVAGIKIFPEVQFLK